MKFTDIPKYTKVGNYEVNMGWDFIPEKLESWKERDLALDLNPDFQRGHVWTDEQRVAWIEYKLAGGPGADTIYFNCPGWMNDFKGPFEIVDGLQRLTALLMFMNDKIRAYGKYYSEFEGRIPPECDLKFNINNLKTRKEVLTWYIQMNSAGTPHSEEEIDRVKDLLEKAQ